MLRSRLCILGIGLLSSVMSIGAQADEPTTTTTTVIQKYTVISPAPTAVCTTVDAKWVGNVWVTKHDVCKYTDRPEGRTWINSYWSCTASTPDGTCTTWSYVPGYWEKN